MPAWGKSLLADREFFAGCGISASSAGDLGQVHKIVYCVQQPHYMALCPLEEIALDEEAQERW